MPKKSQDPAAIKWGESGAEYVCESTGFQVSWIRKVSMILQQKKR